jgi:hypothetical protein
MLRPVIVLTRTRRCVTGGLMPGLKYNNDLLDTDAPHLFKICEAFDAF